jgi:ATP-binding cassette subfamily C protein
MKSSISTSEITFQLIEELDGRPNLFDGKAAPSRMHKGFNPIIEFIDVSFRYPGKRQELFRNLRLTIKAGERISVIGSSGSGKSSLVDLILGQITPDKGGIFLSGLTPRVAQQKFPGAVAYVPQDIFIFEGTIRENILFGLPDNLFNDDAIWEVISQVELFDWVKSLSESLSHKISESGMNR